MPRRHDPCGGRPKADDAREGREGKSYTVQAFADAQGCALAELWIIQGLFHACSGGAPNFGPFDPASDPNAPNMDVKAYDFFMDQLDADGPPGCAKAGGGGTGEGSGGGATAPLAVLVLLGLAGLRGRRWCAAERGVFRGCSPFSPAAGEKGPVAEAATSPD